MHRPCDHPVPHQMAGWFIPWARSVPLYTWPSDAAATRAYESRSKSASTWLASRSPHSVWPCGVAHARGSHQEAPPNPARGPAVPRDTHSPGSSLLFLVHVAHLSRTDRMSPSELRLRHVRLVWRVAPCSRSASLAAVRASCSTSCSPKAASPSSPSSHEER